MSFQRGRIKKANEQKEQAKERREKRQQKRSSDNGDKKPLSSYQKKQIRLGNMPAPGHYTGETKRSQIPSNTPKETSIVTAPDDETLPLVSKAFQGGASLDFLKREGLPNITMPKFSSEKSNLYCSIAAEYEKQEWKLYLYFNTKTNNQNLDWEKHQLDTIFPIRGKTEALTLVSNWHFAAISGDRLYKTPKKLFKTYDLVGNYSSVQRMIDL